jgi:hypothetical protein
MEPLPPPAQLMQLITGKFVTQLITVFAELGVADHLSPPRTAAEIAPSIGADAGALYRAMRALTVVGVVVEQDGGRFSLTPAGELLRSDHPGSLRGMAIFMGRSWHSSAWSELLHSVKTGESAFPKAHGAPIWQWAEKNRAAAEIFNDAMTSFSKSAAPPIVAAYDFSGFQQLADIGGGHGFLLAQVLRQNPSVKGVLFDLPQVVAGAKKTFDGLDGRIEIVAGDFFQSVPRGLDGYMMKHILHDWSDEACIKLLAHCAAGLTNGGRVLVVEQLVSPPNAPGFAKLLDIEMLVMTSGGRERTEQEFGELFARAGLRLNRVVPTVTPVSVLEAVKA